MFDGGQKMDSILGSVCLRSTVPGKEKEGSEPLEERPKEWRVGRGGCNPA